MSIWFTFYCACVSSCEPLLISKLREGGITILGETNLSEWANFRGLNISARWSPWGWPDFGAYYSHSRSDGSSSGSAVAAAPGLNVTAADELKNLNQQMIGIVRSCDRASSGAISPTTSRLWKGTRTTSTRLRTSSTSPRPARTREMQTKISANFFGPRTHRHGQRQMQGHGCARTVSRWRWPYCRRHESTTLMSSSPVHHGNCERPDCQVAVSGNCGSSGFQT